MKTSPASSRRHLLASTGAVLGLLATVGFAAPAQAAVVTPAAPIVQSDRDGHDDRDNNRNYSTGNNRNYNNWNDNHRNNWNNDNDYNRDHNRSDRNNHNNHGDADLHLRIDRDGDYRIRGNDYEDNRVRVWLVNVSSDRTVDSFRVHPNRNGDFTIHGDDLRCNRTYQAVSWSNDDGRDWSNKVYFRCDHK